jgi:phage-related protein
MAGTFIWRPDYPVSQEKAPKIDEATMGDGYTQRAAKGINNNSPTLALMFTKRTKLEGDAIEDFLDLKAGHESFTWVNLRGVSGLYICKTYGRTDHDVDDVEIRANFLRVYGG